MKTGEVVNNVPQLFYNQPNNALMQEVTGSNVSWTITGASRIAFYAPIPPKQMLPRDPTWIDSIMDGVKTVAPWAAVGYLATHGSYTPSTTVKGATTVTLPSATPAP
jgi:hypothetical protein